MVEGYTDVMACHLAGVATAVATCGTAFGDEHARVLRRFLHDHEEFRGEVIFTFDGDAAGQKAALRAFDGDQNFVSQTYVAVEPDGLDPCDLRIQKGDAAVRELVARRVPLYRFVLANVVGKYDLDRADGRVDAVREAARLVSSIRDKSKVDAFSRELAGMVGVDIEQARAEVRARPTARPAATGRPTSAARPRPPRTDSPSAAAPAAARPARPAVLARARDPQAGPPAPLRGRPVDHRRRRQRLHPPDLPRGLGAGRRRRRTERRRRRRRLGQRGCATRATDPAVSSAISALGVEPLLTAKEPDDGLRRAHVYRLRELTAMRRIADLKSRLQRTNPVEHADRLQPDVRRAGRPRAAPPQAARPGGRRLVRRRTKPSGRRRARGRRCWPGPTSADGRGPRRHPRRALPSATGRVALGAGRGGRLGPRHLRRSGSARSASWGESGSSTTSTIDEPGRLLELVRERVTASIVLQRHVPVDGRRGLRVIARRAPRGDRPLAWFYEYDEGVDPDDPEVQRAATEALAAARDEVGLP